MTPNRLLLWKRYFSFPTIIVFAAILFCLSLTSCFPSSFEASYDSSNESEGGPSKLINGDDYGFNIALNWIGGGPNGSAPKSSAGDWIHTHAYTNDGIPASGFEGMSGPSADGKGQWLPATKLQFIQKGSKTDNSRTKLNYLEVVEDAMYQYTFADQSAVYGGLGPYIAYGLGGNVKSGSFKAAAFGGQDGYKRFDAGLHLTGGYQLPVGLYFALGYEFGLVNKSPAPDFTSRNRTFSIAVGYPLNKIFKGLNKK
jgi:hypothetical protein